ncbi:MAG: GGDEF domain-containing protein [Negativicutes bacterium]|nr:GGDEF domain-containing protein [Negativicutes bacterium]
MTVNLFYEKAPAILAVVGISFGLAGYFADKYLQTVNLDITWVIWGTTALVLAVCGRLLGRMLRQLDLFAAVDPLTGLLNRRSFCKVLEIEYRQQTRAKSGLCLAIIDIDNFKTVNDRYGHNIGDTVLKNLSAVLARNIRAYDTIARWGGDEFVLLLPHTEIAGARVVVERIKQAVTQTEWDQNLTVSVGLVAVSENADLEQVLAVADQALYRAKQKRNSVVASA